MMSPRWHRELHGHVRWSKIGRYFQLTQFRILVMKKRRECGTKSSICVVGCNVTQVLQWGGPHPLNAGIHLILPVYIAVIFPSIMTPISQQEIGWPPLHCACCGGAWQISTLQKCWISMDVCLIKTAWPFPDLASRRLWYNGTFIRLSGRDSFSSDLLFSPDSTVYLIITPFYAFWI